MVVNLYCYYGIMLFFFIYGGHSLKELMMNSSCCLLSVSLNFFSIFELLTTEKW